VVKLKDLVNKTGENTGLVTLTTTALAKRINNGITSIAGTSWTTSDTTKFSSQAAQLVTKEEFLDELESKIGDPRKNESEDEFVARSKEQMRNLLKSKLK